MKKLLLTLLLLSVPAFATEPVTQVSGPPDLFGEGGVSDDTFSLYTSGALKEGDSPIFNTGKFNNISIEYTLTTGTRGTGGLSVAATGHTTINADGSSTNLLEVQNGGFPIFKFDKNGRFTSNDLTSGTLNRADNFALILAATDFSIPGIGLRIGDFIFSHVSNTSGIYNAVTIEKHVDQAGTAGFNGLFINITSVDEGIGIKNFWKMSWDGVEKASLDKDGSLHLAGSVFSSYSTTTAPIIEVASADTYFDCDITNNNITFNLYSSSPATRGNEISIVLTKPSGTPAIRKCFVNAKGSQTIRAGSVQFGNHSGMNFDGEAFKYVDTGRGYFKIHGSY
jgi:hypothetical protein